MSVWINISDTTVVQILGVFIYAIHKNLQYIQNIEANAEAAKSVDFYCIHGYSSDGVNSAGASPTEWKWWADGWQTSPSAGIPSNVNGFKAYNKKSWMTSIIFESW